MCGRVGLARGRAGLTVRTRKMRRVFGSFLLLLSYWKLTSNL